jgi:uncharacterized protein (UPF0335 family)
MSKENLKEVIIQNKNYGELDGYKVFLTKELFEYFSKEKAKNGTLLIDLLRQGTLMKGLKHLIISIAKKEKSGLIFTHKSTEKKNDDYYIDYKEYKKSAQEKFYVFYKITGLDAAIKYLNQYFPNEFEMPEEPINEETYKIVDKNFSDIIHNLAEKEKNQKVLIKETVKVLEYLHEEKKSLTQEIDALMELQKKSSIFYYTQKIDDLKERLYSHTQFHETSGKDSWQNWIYNNNWLFGINYQVPIQKEKVGFDSIPDFLFPSLDGFLDILEIKLPTADVIFEDSSHPGSFAWSSDVNKAIGQVINYIHQIELNQLQLKERINESYNDIYSTSICAIKPRVIILIGKSDGWKNSERQAFRKLNYSLHGIEVLTYTDLVQRGERIINLYSEKGSVV